MGLFVDFEVIEGCEQWRGGEEGLDNVLETERVQHMLEVGVNPEERRRGGEMEQHRVGIRFELDFGSLWVWIGGCTRVVDEGNSTELDLGAVETEVTDYGDELDKLGNPRKT